MEYKVKSFESIHQIEESLWDRIVPDEDIFHKHRFIRAVEDARVENSRFWYLLFYEKEEPVASAVLSAFRVNLDIFMTGILKNWILKLRLRQPGFLSPCILFCGLPVSLGQKNLVIYQERATSWVLKSLAIEMDKISRKHQIRFQCIKEFKKSQLEQVKDIEQSGFFQGYSIPYMEMAIRWPGFEEYMDSLRHPYRRMIKKSLRKIRRHKEKGPELTKPRDRSPGKGSSSLPQLKINNWEGCSPQLFYKLYCEVMKGAETRMEMLNEPFFENCIKNLRDDAFLISLEKGKHIFSAALLFHHSNCLTFALIGKEKFKDPAFDPYFNLVYGIVALACQLKCKRLNLGQTAYWVKQRIGGKPEEMFLFLKAGNPVVHFFLKILRRTLFPPFPLKEIHPFKVSSR